jgi:hypothetical protein
VRCILRENSWLKKTRSAAEQSAILIGLLRIKDGKRLLWLGVYVIK